MRSSRLGVLTTACIIALALHLGSTEARAQDGAYGLLGGIASNGFDHGSSFLVGGFLDLPLARVQNVAGDHTFVFLSDIQVTYQRASETRQIAGVDFDAEQSTLSVILGFKGKFAPRARLQPYVATGLGTYVFLTNAPVEALLTLSPAGGVPAGFAESFPIGEGENEVGWNFGRGVDFLVVPKVTLGLEGRYNVVVDRTDANFGFGAASLAFRF